LGYDPRSREENIRRSACVARLFADEGYIVIAAFITPLQFYRDLARHIIGNTKYHEIYIHCDLATCEQRDVKGLYAKARAGIIMEFTGLDAPYEPLHPIHH